MHIFKGLRNNIKIGLLALLIVPFFLGCFCSANPTDLLWQLVEPAYYEETIIGLGTSKETVGKNVFKGSNELDVGISLERRIVKDDEGKPMCKGNCPELCLSDEDGLSRSDRILCRRYWTFESVEVSLEAGVQKQPSLIVKVTRMLLILTITLSVTMILYNGMMYIIKTGQGKEGKDVLKNVAYIVIGILIALFSVIIVRIMQSIPSTIADTDELPQSRYDQDKAAISQNDKGVAWRVTF